MAALRLQEVQIPELRLPEVSREDVIRIIGDARRDVDLTRLDPRRADLSRIELPKVDLATIDIPKAVTTAAEAAGVVRATHRGRLPFVIGGLIALGLVGAALLASPLVRPRLDALGRRVRQRIDEVRISSGGEGEPHAIDAAVAVPVDRFAFTDAAPDDGSPYDVPGPLPDGEGADAGQVNESAEMLVGTRFRPTV